MLDRAFRFLFLLFDKETLFFAKNPITTAVIISLLRAPSCDAQNADNHLERWSLRFLQSVHCFTARTADRN
jgi:hypothetical protein